MARKSFNEKLGDSKDMPKIVDLSGQPEAVARYGGNKMLIAAPLQYNAIMARVPQGKVITVDRIREWLAREEGADFTCPLTAGIFIQICAWASEERAGNGISSRESKQRPGGGTLKASGEQNEKEPGGSDGKGPFEGQIPYWRTLKANGELNEKFPCGIDRQRLWLESEGHTVIQKGKRWFVKDYEKALWEID